MKKLLMTLTVVMTAVVAQMLVPSSALADDMPHWIGLDTTLRDQKTWVTPVETPIEASLDTRVYDVLTSIGETIRSVFTGLIFVVQ